MKVKNQKVRLSRPVILKTIYRNLEGRKQFPTAVWRTSVGLVALYLEPEDPPG